MSAVQRSSALVEVPRVHMPRALKAYALIAHWADMDDSCGRVVDRARSAMMRGRREWAEAERTRDEALARTAARHFDEVAVLLPAHVRPVPGTSSTDTRPMHMRQRPPTTTTRTR